VIVNKHFYTLTIMCQREKSFTEVQHTKKGTCLVASRDIKPLEIILTDVPAIVSPNLGSDISVCCMCLQSLEKRFKCPKCSFLMCSDECVRSESHKEECPYLQRLPELDHDSQMAVLAVVRTLLIRKHGGEPWENIAKLMSHKENRKQNVDEWKLFHKNVAIPILSTLAEDLGVNDDDIEEVIGILNINCASFHFALDFRDGVVDGRALYPTLSLVSHSCVANARYQVNPEDGFTVVLRAKRDIFEGEEITIQYVPPTLGNPKRQLELWNEWFFECDCSRCSDTSEFGTFVSALKCFECHEGLILPELSSFGSAWRCRFCNAPYDQEMIMNIVEKAEIQLQEISLNPSVKQYESFIRKHLRNLHLKHYLNLTAQRNIIELCAKELQLTKEVCQKIIKNCKSYLSVMSRLDPGYSSWKGSILKHHNYAQLQLLKLQLEDNSIDRNVFSVKSEEIWCSMREVDSCDVLCSKHNLNSSIIKR